MAKVITLAHQKSGVGKSTLAVNLAHAFKDNATTAIIDMDAQGSVAQTANKIEGVTLIPLSALESKKYHAIFIDTPPYLSDKLDQVFSLSDLILIPTKAGIYDVLACKRTVDLVKEAMKKKKSLKAAIILNMVNSTTTLTAEAKEQLQSLGLPVLKAQVTGRMNFVRSIALPDGIYSTNDTKAIKEINVLTKEILFMLNS
ncbi:MAG: ParA family protein [Ginsengibacter sp.]